MKNYFLIALFAMALPQAHADFNFDPFLSSEGALFEDDSIFETQDQILTHF